MCRLRGEGGLLALCLEEVRGGGGGDKEGDLRLFLSQRSLVGDLRDPLPEEKEGDGVRRIRGGDGVTGTRFLYGDLDLRLQRGDLLRDLKIYNKKYIYKYDIFLNNYFINNINYVWLYLQIYKNIN